MTLSDNFNPVMIYFTKKSQTFLFIYSVTWHIHIILWY